MLKGKLVKNAVVQSKVSLTKTQIDELILDALGITGKLEDLHMNYEIDEVGVRSVEITYSKVQKL